MRKFNFLLDKFLEHIPDEHALPNNVTTSSSSSILDQPSLIVGLKEYTKMHGGVPDSAVNLVDSKPLEVF